MNLIEKAIAIATKAHEGQVRKGSNLPYITHPYTVGMILMMEHCKEEIVAAGILHDTVEDTSITLEDIRAEFGEKVAQIVEGCSEPNKELSWEERKEHTIEFLRTASNNIRLVACADKLHNIRSTRKAVEEDGEEIWSRFNRGKEQQAWYYQNVVKSLGHKNSFKLLDVLKEEVESLFEVKIDL